MLVGTGVSPADKTLTVPGRAKLASTGEVVQVVKRHTVGDHTAYTIVHQNGVRRRVDSRLIQFGPAFEDEDDEGEVDEVDEDEAEEAEEYDRGDVLLYVPTGETVHVIKKHFDLPNPPYYTIKMENRREKQTTAEMLERIEDAEDDDEDSMPALEDDFSMPTPRTPPKPSGPNLKQSSITTYLRRQGSPAPEGHIGWRRYLGDERQQIVELISVEQRGDGDKVAKVLKGEYRTKNSKVHPDPEYLDPSLLVPVRMSDVISEVFIDKLALERRTCLWASSTKQLIREAKLACPDIEFPNDTNFRKLSIFDLFGLTEHNQHMPGRWNDRKMWVAFLSNNKEHICAMAAKCIINTPDDNRQAWSLTAQQQMLEWLVSDAAAKAGVAFRGPESARELTQLKGQLTAEDLEATHEPVVGKKTSVAVKPTLTPPQAHEEVEEIDEDEETTGALEGKRKASKPSPRLPPEGDDEEVPPKKIGMPEAKKKKTPKPIPTPPPPEESDEEEDEEDEPGSDPEPEPERKPTRIKFYPMRMMEALYKNDGSKRPLMRTKPKEITADFREQVYPEAYKRSSMLPLGKAMRRVLLSGNVGNGALAELVKKLESQSVVEIGDRWVHYGVSEYVVTQTTDKRRDRNRLYLEASAKITEIIEKWHSARQRAEGARADTSDDEDSESSDNGGGADSDEWQPGSKGERSRLSTGSANKSRASKKMSKNAGDGMTQRSGGSGGTSRSRHNETDYGATPLNAGIHPKQMDTAKRLVNEAVLQHGIDSDVETLLLTINAAVLAISPTSSIQAAALCTVVELAHMIEAQQCSNKAASYRKRAIQRIAQWMNVYVQGRQWMDKGARVDQCTWDEMLDAFSKMLLDSEWITVLERKLSQRRFTTDQNIWQYWDEFHQAVNTWPASMRLSEKELCERFLDSMPSAIQARSKDEWRRKVRQGEVDIYQAALNAVVREIDVEAGGGNDLEQVRSEVSRMRAELNKVQGGRHKPGPNKALGGDRAAEDDDQSTLTDAELDLIANVDTANATCSYCKSISKADRFCNHPKEACFERDNPYSDVPRAARAMYRCLSAAKVLCETGSHNSAHDAEVQRAGVNPREYHAFVEANQKAVMNGQTAGGRLKPCGCSFKDATDFKGARDCKNNVAVTAMMRHAAKNAAARSKALEAVAYLDYNEHANNNFEIQFRTDDDGRNK